MTERIRNLTVEAENVRAGDSRVNNALFNELAEMSLQTNDIKSAALQILAANGEQEEVATGRFLACKEGTDSKSSPIEELEVRKRTIADRLTKIITDSYSQQSPEELREKEYSGNPFMTIPSEELRVHEFGVYDKRLDAQMSYDQRRKGLGREAFMNDVFALIHKNLGQGLATGPEDKQGYGFRLEASGNNMVIYLKRFGQSYLSYGG